MPQRQYLSTNPDDGEDLTTSPSYLSMDPDEGDELVSEPAPVAGQDPGAMGRLIVDAAKGAGKQLLDTGRRGGALLRKIPGVDALSNALPYVDIAPEQLELESPAQHVGAGLEQVAEVLTPSRAVSALGTKLATKAAPSLARWIKPATEAVGNAAIARAQGADAGSAATSGVLAAALGPVASRIAAAAPTLRAGAEKKVVQALGPTKERFKAQAEKLAPGVLARGLRGSREALAGQAREQVERVGPQIDDALQQFGGRAVDTRSVLQALEEAKTPFRATNAAGQAVTIDARPLRQLEKLQQVVTELGPEARVDQLVAVRRAWDKVVAQAGGYAHRGGGAVGLPLREQTEAWAKREATGAIRRLLDQEVPELAALNKEFAFWKGLDDVLGQTLKRTQAQGPGLGAAVAEGAGQMVGATMGSAGGPAGTVGGAFAVGKIAQLANAVFRSPRWKLIDAHARDRLARAIASGDEARAARGITDAAVRVGILEGPRSLSALWSTP